jgi:hypothetical protein
MSWYPFSSAATGRISRNVESMIATRIIPSAVFLFCILSPPSIHKETAWQFHPRFFFRRNVPANFGVMPRSNIYDLLWLHIMNVKKTRQANSRRQETYAGSLNKGGIVCSEPLVPKPISQHLKLFTGSASQKLHATLHKTPESAKNPVLGRQTRWHRTMQLVN